MPDDSTGAQPDLPAGDFSSWMSEMQGALRGERDAEVPCGGCTGCCTSHQFVHIGPDETDTLAHIPRELLFPAPMLPPGHFVLGYDERGHCPMLVDNRCSIYQHRPRTCRTYDCRVFPAAGLEVDGDRVRIARQAVRWRFSFPSETDRIRRAAVQAAATYLHDHRSQLPARSVPANTTQLAVLAIQIHELFFRRDEGTGKMAIVQPDLDAVRQAVGRQSSAARPSPHRSR